MLEEVSVFVGISHQVLWAVEVRSLDMLEFRSRRILSLMKGSGFWMLGMNAGRICSLE